MKQTRHRIHFLTTLLIALMLAACPAGINCYADEAVVDEISGSEEIIFDMPACDEFLADDADESVPEEQQTDTTSADPGYTETEETDFGELEAAYETEPEILVEDTYAGDVFVQDDTSELIEDVNSDEVIFENDEEIIFEDSEELAIGTGRPEFASAQTLSMDTSRTVTGDTWFKLTIPGGTKKAYHFTTTSGPGTSPFLFLYYADGAEVPSSADNYHDGDSPSYVNDVEIRVSLSEGVYYLLVRFFTDNENPASTCVLKAATYSSDSSVVNNYDPGPKTVSAWIYDPGLSDIYPGQSITLKAGWASNMDKQPDFKWELVPTKRIKDTDGSFIWDIDESKPRQTLPSTTTQVTVKAPSGCDEMMRIGFTVTVKGYDYADDYIEIWTAPHTQGSWNRTVEPTVFTPGTEVWICKYCGQALDTRSVAQLSPSISMNVAQNSTVPLKIGQSTKKIKVTSLQPGDYVTSWKSSKPKIASVNQKGKITGKKKGKAVITVTTAAGATYSFKIKVQKQKVATSKIVTEVSKSVTLKKKGKIKIGAELLPLTTLDKLSYTTSSKKIATVKKGTITAKGKGTAVITVKAGKKKVKIKVRVTK